MLINGDCFNYVQTIPDNSVDLILIDPPYLISKESNFKNYSDSANKELVTKYGDLSIDFGDWDKVYIDWISLFKEYNRILKDGGTLIVFFDIWKSGLIKEAAELNKFKQPRVCQWQKTNPVPVNSKKNYLSNAIEYFFTFTKGKNPTFNSEYDNGVYRYPICHGKERLNHPTQKPLRLIVDLINKHSKPGDVVLDTFAGSGTTGHASILTGRNYILVEKSEEYFKILEERIKNVSNKKEF
jgi:site-specific DNA-methyltransferase (adenine-specific)